jgi:hypothetical protein
MFIADMVFILSFVAIACSHRYANKGSRAAIITHDGFSLIAGICIVAWGLNEKNGAQVMYFICAAIVITLALVNFAVNLSQSKNKKNWR